MENSKSLLGMIAAIALVGIFLLPAPSVAVSPRHASAPVRVDGYSLQGISLPNFAYLYPYLYNYRLQYPVVDFTSPCAGGILYIDNSSKMDCFNPTTRVVTVLSGALTLLHQRTAGIQAQIDNEFQLDTPYDVALLYGNRTTSPGNVTLETLNLTTGTITIVDTPVPMANGLQCDYVGKGIVIAWNGTGADGAPEMTNMSNGTSWRSGLSVGVAPDNVYWVSQLNAFIDIAGTHMAELKIVGNAVKNVGNAWANRSGLTSITAVDGVLYNATTGQVAVTEATNLGPYMFIGKLTGGALTKAGTVAYLTPFSFYVQRYAYTLPFVWAINTTAGYASTGPTVLVNPFGNVTRFVPNLVTRANASGANGNYEFTNPYSVADYLSLNVSLIGNATRAPNQFVWATAISPPQPTPGTGSNGGSGGVPTNETNQSNGSAPSLAQRILSSIPLTVGQIELVAVGAILIVVALLLRGRPGIVLGIVGGATILGAFLV